jgi:CheY-like chemotaxis protein
VIEPIDILLVEDSPTDLIMAREALEDSPAPSRLHTVMDGVEAMEFLWKKGPYVGVPRPGLILMDLNLPKKSGREVLVEIKGDNSLRRIPVVILSTSKAEEDIERSYGLHANCYITKPVDFWKFRDVVRSIQEFWFTVVTLPS